MARTGAAVVEVRTLESKAGLYLNGRGRRLTGVCLWGVRNGNEGLHGGFGLGAPGWVEVPGTDREEI